MISTTELHERIYEMSEQLAKKYKRKCWWASYDDLKQEAVAEMLRKHKRAVARGQIDVDDPFGYLYRAAAVKLRNTLLRDSAPVSASNHSLEKLKGLMRAPTTRLLRQTTVAVRTEEGGEFAMKVGPATDATDLVDDIGDADWLRRARHRLSVVLGAVKNTAIATEVLIEKRRPAEVAAEVGVTVKEVYRAVSALKSALVNDRELYALTQEVVGRSRRNL